MWSKSTKQRRAARRRKRAYDRAWDIKMKTLAFGWLYSSPRPPAPPGVLRWLEWRNNQLLTKSRDKLDFESIELRMLSSLAKSSNYPIVVAVQQSRSALGLSEYSPTGRRWNIP